MLPELLATAAPHHQEKESATSRRDQDPIRNSREPIARTRAGRNHFLARAARIDNRLAARCGGRQRRRRRRRRHRIRRRYGRGRSDGLLCLLTDRLSSSCLELPCRLHIERIRLRRTPVKLNSATPRRDVRRIHCTARLRRSIQPGWKRTHRSAQRPRDKLAAEVPRLRWRPVPSIRELRSVGVTLRQLIWIRLNYSEAAPCRVHYLLTTNPTITAAARIQTIEGIPLAVDATLDEVPAEETAF